MTPSELDILYRDEHLLAVNKPAGLATHAAEGHREKNLVAMLQRWLESQGIAFEGPLAPANRLDAEVSGIILFALDAETRTRLGKLVQAQGLRKVYWAIVAGRTRHKGVINRDIVDDGVARTARTRYRTLSTSGRFSLIKVSIDTGRKHQIRRHLTAIGHPILGDRRYGHTRAAVGFRRRFEVERIMLHARQITCEHPMTGRRLHLVCSPDASWFDIMDELGLALAPPVQGSSDPTQQDARAQLDEDDDDAPEA